MDPPSGSRRGPPRIHAQTKHEPYRGKGRPVERRGREIGLTVTEPSQKDNRQRAQILCPVFLVEKIGGQT